MEYWSNGELEKWEVHYSVTPLSPSPPLYAASVILGDRVPVHHVPPGFDIIGPAVLVVEVIRVLPDIHAENRLVAFHEWTVLVGRRDDLELAALVFDQPRPATAEAADASGGEFFLERVETAKRGLDILGQLTFRVAAGFRAQDLPKEGMIGVSAPVVAHDCTDVVRHSLQIADQVFDGFLFEIAFAFDRVVDVGDVSLVMLGMMDLHRARVDVRFERVVSVR